MSERMKGRLTSKYIEIVVGIPGMQESTYKIPNTANAKEHLKNFLKKISVNSVPWRELAAERISRFSEAGLVLRGARYREGISQKELAKKCGVSQDNLSRMENGKRAIGEEVAKKLAKALRLDYTLLLTKKRKNKGIK